MGGRFIIAKPGGATLQTETANSYSITAADAGKIINMTGSTASVNFDANGSTLQPGDEVTIINNQNNSTGSINTANGVTFIIPSISSPYEGITMTSLTLQKSTLCKFLCISNTLYYVHSHGRGVS